MAIRLTEHGLTQLGAWRRSDAYASVAHLVQGGHAPFGLDFDLPPDWRTRRNVVYAFVAGDAVLYVGETSKGMAERFACYRYGNTVVGDTDNRVKCAITRALLQGVGVGIWACQPRASLILPDGSALHVPASKPLEEHLIALVDPQENVKRLIA